MNKLHIYHTRPLCLRDHHKHYQPQLGDYVITLSDIPGTKSSFYKVQQSTSRENIYYYDDSSALTLEYIGTEFKHVLEKKHNELFQALITLRPYLNKETNELQEQEPIMLDQAMLDELYDVYKPQQLSNASSPRGVREIRTPSPTKHTNQSTVRFFGFEQEEETVTPHEPKKQINDTHAPALQRSSSFT